MAAVTQHFSVAGIGASAGGITALQALFSSIDSAPNLAFVIVQHLPPDQPSKLTKLFATWTKLPVCEVSNGVTVQPGCVYVAPPGRALELHQGVFSVLPLARPGAHAGLDTIDSFFESLADDLGHRAIA